MARILGLQDTIDKTFEIIKDAAEKLTTDEVAGRFGASALGVLREITISCAWAQVYGARPDCAPEDRQAVLEMVESFQALQRNYVGTFGEEDNGKR